MNGKTGENQQQIPSRDRFNKAEDGTEAGGSIKSAPPVIRKVTGCGRNHGFQLVVDSQQMMTLFPKAHLALGFKVFVSQPGVVTSRVPFHVDPGFYGEHNFFIHGIHDIKVS